MSPISVQVFTFFQYSNYWSDIDAHIYIRTLDFFCFEEWFFLDAHTTGYDACRERYDPLIQLGYICVIGTTCALQMFFDIHDGNLKLTEVFICMKLRVILSQEIQFLLNCSSSVLKACLLSVFFVKMPVRFFA